MRPSCTSTQGGPRLAVVQGSSYGRRHETENLALRFHRPPGPGLQIGLLHCHTGNDAAHAPYSPCRIEDLPAAAIREYAAREQVILFTCYPGTAALFEGSGGRMEVRRLGNQHSRENQSLWSQASSPALGSDFFLASSSR
jgi:hypothetical protein